MRAEARELAFSFGLLSFTGLLPVVPFPNSGALFFKGTMALLDDLWELRCMFREQFGCVPEVIALSEGALQAAANEGPTSKPPLKLFTARVEKFKDHSDGYVVRMTNETYQKHGYYYLSPNNRTY